MQIAVINANQWCCQLKGSLQLRAIMYLYQHIQPHLSGSVRQFAHLLIRERSHNQQHRICTKGSGFYHLVGIHSEVLAQYR